MQQKSAPRIKPRSLAGQREKILAEKNILHPVAIEISHSDAKGGGPLCFPRQESRLPMIPAIKKNHRSQGGGFDFLRARLLWAENVKHRGLAIGAVRTKALEKKWQDTPH